MSNSLPVGDRSTAAVKPASQPGDTRRLGELIVAQAAPTSTYTERQLRVAVLRFVDWCHHQAALPLNATVLLDNYVIERYIAQLTEYGDHSRGTIRSRLREVARIVGPPGRQVSLVQYPKSTGSEPYSASEIGHFRSWARTQATESRRRNASALLALGFGAGLLPAEIIDVRTSDIQATALGPAVLVRCDAERTVPVLTGWHDLIPRTSNAGEDGLYLFRPQRTTANPNAITNFIAAARPRVQLTCRRMRATWLVHHLDVGTPLVALLHAAGLHTAEALDPFLQFARPWSDHELEMALRR